MMKYIPSIVSAFSIAIVYFKMAFISQGYQPILDIVIMIILSVVLGVSLLGAILMEFSNKRKN
ncbi:hypothetical protein [Oceanobacillus halotolerans]|uniref:hypothetical protein n=1 Tax=Oceanobacillus halotolerans TaxID=2663380 RepID=UPI0013DBBF4F|nr:hypothetical protein [Oceanobacillus halotolerans]